MKKIMIIISIILVLLVGIYFFIFNENETRTIYLEINPRIKIKLDEKSKIKKIIALNDDAKKIVDKSLVNKELNEAFVIIRDRLIENDFITDDNVTILLRTSDDLDSEEIKNGMNGSFSDKRISIDVIIIDNITNEDKLTAIKYNVSPEKAVLLNNIEKNVNISIEKIKDKPIKELKETEETGNYCPEDYFLDGGFCKKEKEQVDAKYGDTCESEYFYYNGKCYKEVGSIETEKYICREEFTLKEDKCTRALEEGAIPVKFECTKGEKKTRLEVGLTNSDSGDANDIICVDMSNATHPMGVCELPADDPTERMSAGGKCYWHRAPVIESGCPGKIQVDGFCWDDATNILICVGARDGKRYSSKDEYCEESIKYYEPTITEYKCNDGFKLSGNKCFKDEIEDAEHEKICPNGYEFLDGRCVDKKDVKEKIQGYICDMPQSRLKNDKCIIYEEIEANHN